MNFGEVIQNWRSGVDWVDNTINPYVTRDLNFVWMNPANYGEVIARFTIIDKSFILNGNVLEYRKEMEYHSTSLNGSADERECEAARLRRELSDFTEAAIAERQQQINDLRAAGETVLTTNPYDW